MVQLIWLQQKGLVKIVVRGVVGVGRADYFCPTLVHGELSRSSSAEREMPRKCGWWRSVRVCRQHHHTWTLMVTIMLILLFEARQSFSFAVHTHPTPSALPGCWLAASTTKINTMLCKQVRQAVLGTSRLSELRERSNWIPIHLPLKQICPSSSA